MDAGNIVLGAFLVYAYFLFFDVRFVSKAGRGRPLVDGFIAPWTDQSLFQLLKTARWKTAWKSGSDSLSVQSAGYAGVMRRARRRSSLARPYIWRLTSLSLVI
jgi:hypothetical protein